MGKVPQTLKYTKDHEWCHEVSGNTISIGITDFAQSSLGDIIFVELPEIGQEVSEGGSFGVVESIKSVSDLYSPLSGKVVEVNSQLVDSPEQINSAPYESWLIKIEGNLNGDELLSSEDYEKFCSEA